MDRPSSAPSAAAAHSASAVAARSQVCSRELGDGVNVAVAAQTVGNGIVNGAAQGDLAQRQRIPETPQGQEPQPQQEQQKQQERQAAPGQGKDPQEKQGAGGAAQQQRQGQNRRAEGG